MQEIKPILKMIMAKKNIKTGYIADTIGMDRQQLSNWLYLNDGKSLLKMVQIANALDCDIAIIDRKTGEVYK